jgi:hypothetical protein
MDLINFHFDKSVFSNRKRYKKTFWNPKWSWENKWKIVESDVGIGVDITRERFWGSSRWFVFLTDAWHLFQFFMIQLMMIAVLAHSELQWLDLLAPLGWYAGFWVTFESKLLRK